ncbi:MAG: hypothetical protein ACYTEZ_07620 [Planctomycetota bacterium]|jgi:hypothetical protein
MDDIIRKLRMRGALKRLRTGDEGVEVSLMYEPRPEGASRAERRRFLEDEFRVLADEIDEAELDLGSISVTGQTVSAKLPVDRLQVLCDRLQQRHIRVDIIVDRQIV